MEYLGGINIESLKNTYQVEDNVGVAFNIALLQCLMLCLRTNTCLTLFFKNVNEQCILHSKTFHYKSPTGIEMGWEVYQIVDCKYFPSKLFLYNILDLMNYVKNFNLYLILFQFSNEMNIGELIMLYKLFVQYNEL